MIRDETEGKGIFHSTLPSSHVFHLSYELWYERFVTSGLGTNSNHMHISVHRLLRNFFGGLGIECKRGKMFQGCVRKKKSCFMALTSCVISSSVERTTN